MKRNAWWISLIFFGLLVLFFFFASPDFQNLKGKLVLFSTYVFIGCAFIIFPEVSAICVKTGSGSLFKPEKKHIKIAGCALLLLSVVLIFSIFRELT